MQQHKWWGWFGISLSSFLGCIDFTIVNTALPSIQMELGATVAQLQWVITLFLLALAAFMVVMGRLADLYGRRRILYIGMWLFALSSLGAGLSQNIQQLIFFRLIQGVGVAILYPVTVAIVGSIFPYQERGRATTLLFGVNGFGLAIGPVVGGFIVSALSWRWVFLVNLPIIIVSFLICIRTIPESKSHEFGTTIDWLGFVGLAVACPLLIFTTVEAASWGWGSWRVIMGYGLALACLVAFYFVEQRSSSPLLQLKLFANRIFVAATLANFLLAFFYTVSFFILPLYLYHLLNKTSYQIGLTLLPATILIAVLSPVVGRTLELFGVRKNLLFGFGLLVVSAYLQTHFGANTHLTAVITALVVLGAGWAFILSPTFVAALSTASESMSGVVTGMVGTLHNLGGALGLALGTLLYEHQAHAVIMAQAVKLRVPAGSWVEQAIANPEDAVQIIRQAAHVDVGVAQQWAINFFGYSFTSLMWLLVAVAATGFLTAWVGLKNK